VDRRAGLDDYEKRTFLTLPGLELRPLSRPAVASRYTDYTTPAPRILGELRKTVKNPQDAPAEIRTWHFPNAS
jgi:hypothetical protein